MLKTGPLTAAQLLELPSDAYRYDLIRGALIKMNPAGGRHGRLSARMAKFLGIHVGDGRLGDVFGAETGFLLARDPDVVLAPDAAYVRADRMPPDEEQDGFLAVAPDLVVEVVSPSDRSQVVSDKVMEYLEAGVGLVWLIEPRRKTLTAYTPDRTARVLTADQTLDGGSVLPDFRLPLKDLFD